MAVGEPPLEITAQAMQQQANRDWSDTFSDWGKNLAAKFAEKTASLGGLASSINPYAGAAQALAQVGTSAVNNVAGRPDQIATGGQSWGGTWGFGDRVVNYGQMDYQKQQPAGSDGVAAPGDNWMVLAAIGAVALLVALRR